MKIPSSNLGRTFSAQKLFLTFRTIFVHNMFSPCSAKRGASDKDLPVPYMSAKNFEAFGLYNETYFYNFEHYALTSFFLYQVFVPSK
jgi:hypothetical protein